MGPNSLPQRQTTQFPLALVNSTNIYLAPTMCQAWSQAPRHKEESETLILPLLVPALLVLLTNELGKREGILGRVICWSG